MADTIKIDLQILDGAAKNAMANFINQGTKADSTFSKLKQTGQSTFADIALSISKTSGVYDIFAGNLAANLVGKAFDVITGSIGNLISEAAGSEQAIKNLNVALQNAGQFTVKASNDLQSFAGALQATTIYSDEAILSSATLLLNLTSLSKDGVQKATRAAADLAATLNIDLGSATDLITKSINGNNTAFKKMGIEIQSADTDSERLKNTLKALQSQSGASSAVTDTYSGAIEKLKNQKSELFEAVGKLITQSSTYVGGIETQASVYQSLANFITDNTKVIRDLGTAVAITTGIIAAGAAAYAVASAGIGILAVSAYTGVGAFGALSIAASAAWAAISAPVTIVVAAVAATVGVVYQLVKNWESVKAATYDAIASMIEFSATTAGIVSSGLETSLNKQAEGYRNQAVAIRQAISAAEEKANQDATSELRSQQQLEIDRKRQEDARRDAEFHAEYLRSVAQLNADEIALIESAHAQASFDLLNQYNEQKALANADASLRDLEQFYAANEARLAAKQEFDRRELELQIAKQVAQAKSETDDRKRKEELQKIYDKAQIDRIKLLNKQEVDDATLKVENQKALDKKREEDQRDAFSTIATLSRSNNQVLATIGKAAALTQIAIDGPQAVTKAFAAFPPPFNFAVAGAVAAAVAAQAAQVAGVQFADGGIVPGTSYSGDRIQARLNSSEMVLNRTQQTELFKMANGQGSGSNDYVTNSQMVAYIDQIISRPNIIQVDGRELIAVTRDQLSSGRTIY